MNKVIVVCAVLLTLPLAAFAGALPDTGQTKCYDNTHEIACPNPGEPFYGQDAQYSSNPHSYTDLGNGIVRDNVTGLEWQQDTALGTYDWQQAIDYCDGLVLGGYSDWRLPTIKELSSLVDSSIQSPDPTINNDYFPNTVSSSYWSSTTTAGFYYPNLAWLVTFYYGYVVNDGKSPLIRKYVRAVRGDQWGVYNFIDNGDGTITDTSTGLMWQKDSAPDTLTWQQALSYCENFTLAGYDDWRLPNRNELQSIVDYRRFNPSIDPVFNVALSWGYYWSSTTYTSNPSFAWFVTFQEGVIFYTSNDSDKSYGYYVRAVRDLCGVLGDADGDTVCNNVDNCPIAPNSDQSDFYPPQGNGIGNACDCEGNFDCNMSVDGMDAATFKVDYGRSEISEPCTNEAPCNGDFSCNGNVDGLDAALFKSDFGRSGINNPCPACGGTDPWCVYP
jgi:hypothetical protein